MSIQQAEPNAPVRFLPADLEAVLASRVGMVCVETREEVRYLSDLRLAALGTGRDFWIWTATKGFQQARSYAEIAVEAHSIMKAESISESDATKRVVQYKNPALFNNAPIRQLAAALGHIDVALTNLISKGPLKEKESPSGDVFDFRGYGKNSMPWIVFLDAWRYVAEHAVEARALRDLTFRLRAQGLTLIFLDAKTQASIPGLDIDALRIQPGTPGADELRKQLSSLLRQSKATSPVVIPYEAPDKLAALVTACKGLSLVEMRNFVSIAIRNATEDPSKELIAEVTKAKVESISKGGMLTFYPPKPMAEIGGMGEFKRWIGIRKRAFSPEALKFGVKAPKGVLMLGVPGTGKSASVAAVASLLEVPCLRLDMGQLFAGLVGASEENTRKTLALAEKLSPCVLWLDEIEKGLSGAASSGSSDGGTMSRVMGTILSWMNDKRDPVFVMATANDISKLPPELLRKGRFDEIFFVDLPNADERKEILGIHIRKTGRNPDAITNSNSVGQILEATEGFSGAEIEGVVQEAVLIAFDDGMRDLTVADLTQAANATRPLSKTMGDQIKAMQAFGRDRARLARSLEVVKPSPAPLSPLISYQSDDFDA
jgi:ATP-dependent 26S proteasome regulatory subunit